MNFRLKKKAFFTTESVTNLKKINKRTNCDALGDAEKVSDFIKYLSM